MPDSDLQYNIDVTAQTPKGVGYVLPNGTVLPRDAAAAPIPSSAVPLAAFDPFTLDPGALDPDYARMQAGFGRSGAAAVGNALKSIWDFIKVPGDVAAGKYSLDEISRMAPGYALGLATGGTPAGAALAPEASLGIFGGVKSLRAPMNELARARRLESTGVSPETVHSLTGWFRGADKDWRYTISDEEAELNREAFRPNQLDPTMMSLKDAAPLQLRDVLDHPELFAAYPKLSEYPIGRTRLLENASGVRGVFSPGTKSFRLGGGEPQNILSSLLHETQHSVQDIEGFVPGGSLQLPADFAERWKQLRARQSAFVQVAKAVHSELPADSVDALEHLFSGDALARQDLQALDKLHPQLQRNLWPIYHEASTLQNQSARAHDTYRRLAGEVEARAVQEQLAQRDWSTPPWRHTGYIPFENQIVGRRGTAPALSFTGWHGTPHGEFTRFSNEAIGTGEGAQAFGYGHYIAGNPKVAEGYRKPAYVGSPGVFSLGGTRLSAPDDLALVKGTASPQDTAHDWLLAAAQELPKSSTQEVVKRALEHVDRAVNSSSELAHGIDPKFREVAAAASDWLRSNADKITMERDRGHLLEVHVKPDEHELLDWDKPFSQQTPAIRQVLRDKFGVTTESEGRDIYRKIVRDFGGRDYPNTKEEAASKALHEAGIPGIKYFDQGSRTAGKGTYNYVIFDPSNLEIRARNGQKLVPVEHNPFEAPALVPVDHDPFGGQ